MVGTLTYLTVDKKGRITLPEEIRRELGVTAGDLVLLERTEHGTFELVPADLIPRDQLWFHQSEMRQRIGEAEEELAAGGGDATSGALEAQAFLDRLKD